MRRSKWLLLGLLAAASCKSYAPSARSPRESGLASVYHPGLAGRLTANGERYDPDEQTCAHRTLPFGTRVELRVVRTGSRAVCRINDRGPFVRGRIIDLSTATAAALGLGPKALTEVELRLLDR